MKILYAASNNYHSKIQLERFLLNVDKSKFKIKISAYKNYLPNYNVDWTLDCLNNINLKYYSFTENRYLDIYLDQVRKYNPDLIISDCELYSSYIASQTGIKLWHASNSLLNYAIHTAYKKYLNLYKNYSLFFNEQEKVVNSLIDVAEKNYLYSHWGDFSEPPSIKENFNWIRPYYVKGAYSQPCQHNFVAVNPNNNPKIFDFLKDKNDCIIFTSNPEIKYQSLTIKNINYLDEYKCNMYNSNFFICDGTATYLADAYYNNKKIILIPEIENKDSMFNYLLYNNIYNYLLENDILNHDEVVMNPEIKFLHQHLENL